MKVKLLIICEGNTDQTLIGNYIEGVTDWRYQFSVGNNPFLNEEINWYKENRTDDLVGVWVNGDNDFKRTLEKICDRETKDHLIENLIIITDNDDDSASTARMSGISKILGKSLKIEDKIVLKCNGWEPILFENSFGMYTMNVGYLLVPINENGALETFMIEAICDSKLENEEVVEQVDVFLNGFKSDVYLKKRRERIKARFGVSLAIMAPDKSTKNMREIITSVDWHKYQIANEQMKMILDIIKKE